MQAAKGGDARSEKGNEEGNRNRAVNHSPNIQRRKPMDLKLEIEELEARIAPGGGGDHGTNGHGSKDHGSNGHGSKDHGSKCHGSK